MEGENTIRNLTDNEMLNIYRALSQPEEVDYDIRDTFDFILNCIEAIYDSDFKRIDSTLLLSNQMLLNNKFLELVKYSHAQDSKFKNIGYLFVGFVDYFDLDAASVYNNLHEKLQLLIRNSTIKNVGSRTYLAFENKYKEHPEINIPTVFNLVKNRNK